jgi:carbamate kinase
VRIVVALGGNALLERGEKPDAEIQQHHVLRAVVALAPLCRDHDLVITHGNGPQVGVLALESDTDRALSHAYPLDVIGAQTQGMIGYWLLQAFENAVPGRRFASLVCQTVVASDDSALRSPSKFVGQVYTKERAEQLAVEQGWQVRQDGPSWRRVVPSPLPKEIVELPVIDGLVSLGVTVICAGGGGIPVLRNEDGLLYGIEAVIDKDRTAALLAEALHADALLLLTDVRAVEVNFGTPAAREIRQSSTAELRALHLPDGSMGPKVAAACDFFEATGRFAAIGRLQDAEALLAGSSGTSIGALPSS